MTTAYAVLHMHFGMKGRICPEHGPIDESGELGEHIVDILYAAYKSKPVGADRALFVAPDVFTRWKAHTSRLGWSTEFSGYPVIEDDRLPDGGASNLPSVSVP